VAVIAVAGAWPMWRGGFNPPARFLVPIVPALALAVAARLRGGWSAGAALLVAWGLWTGGVGTWDRALVHRDRDGTAPLLRAASGAEEWTRLLPGYVLEESQRDRVRLSAVWAVALAAAAWAGRKRGPVTPTGLAVGSLGLLAATGVASRLSTARTGGRDAVRLVGRPSVLAPGWTFLARTPGLWTTDALGGGPLYEPHRVPEGAMIGDRLGLAPGEYVLTLEGEAVPSALPPPQLLSGPEGATPRSFALTLAAGRLTGRFGVEDGRATTLRLTGGGPFIIKGIRVEAGSTFSPPSGLSH
jgi:hypothetical protein